MRVALRTPDCLKALVLSSVFVSFSAPAGPLASQLELAVHAGDVAAANHMIAQGAEVNAKDRHGATSLHAARGKSYTAIVALKLNCSRYSEDCVRR
jgi:hypothetical protein